MIYNRNNLEPIADIGGHRLLGMRGSLTRYIETGNSFRENNFKNSPADSFVANEQKSIKKKENILKKLTLIGTALASAVAVFNIIKKKKISFKHLNIDKIKDKLKSIPSSNLFKEGVEKLKPLGNNLKNSKIVKHFFKK